MKAELMEECRTIEQHLYQVGKASTTLVTENQNDEGYKGYVDPKLCGEFLEQAAYTGHHLACELVLEIGVEKGYMENALLVAADQGKENIVRLLGQKGTRLDTKDVDEATPLIIAASKGHYLVAKYLLDEGADIEITDAYNETALVVAVKGGKKSVTELLLARGADMEARSWFGDTPLIIAVEKDDDELVGMLLKDGARIDATKLTGEPAFQVAKRIGSKPIIEMFEKYKRRNGRVYLPISDE